MFDVFALGLTGAASAVCEHLIARAIPYIVCRVHPSTDEIRLFHADAEGKPFGHFQRVERALEAEGLKLVFAMNAGMYHPSRAPVGLYIERGTARAAVNNRDCSGNFCLKPNGVFWVGDRSAHVTTTEDFATVSLLGKEGEAKGCRARVCYATQSGPMLVIDGEIHPKFLADSTSRYRRNGVGVTAEGEVAFAISDAPVTFHEFATFFRDDLKTPNALYLDGAVSRLYSPEVGRNEPGPAMGPIVGVVERDLP